MKRRSILFLCIVLLSGCCGTTPQNTPPLRGFRITADTIRSDVTGCVRPFSRLDLTHAVKYRGKYYCIFSEQNMITHSPKQLILAISEEGKVEWLDAPDSKMLFTTYLDLFVRDDRLLLKFDISGETYRFDPETRKWVKTEEADDVIYEDDDYVATYLDFGEWGETTWFRNKHTGKEYELSSSGAVVNRVGDAYYITDDYQILKIDDPTELEPCTPGRYYRSVKEKYAGNKFYTTYYSQAGAELVYGSWFKPSIREILLNPRPPVLSVISSFVRNGKLFHLWQEGDALYVAELRDRKMVPLLPVKGRMSFSDARNSYRCRIQRDGSQLLHFHTSGRHLFGVMELSPSGIRTHFLKLHAEPVKPLGTDRFAELFGLICSDIDSLPVSGVYAFEKRIGGVAMRPDNHMFILYSLCREVKCDSLFQGTDFLHLQDPYMAHIASYYGAKSDSLVKVVSFWWKEPKLSNGSGVVPKEPDPRFRMKADEIEKIIRARLGAPVEADRKLWRMKDGWKVRLDDLRTEIRVVVFKE